LFLPLPESRSDTVSMKKKLVFFCKGDTFFSRPQRTLGGRCLVLFCKKWAFLCTSTEKERKDLSWLECSMSLLGPLFCTRSAWSYRAKFRFNEIANECAMRCRMQNHPTRKVSDERTDSEKNIINCMHHVQCVYVRDTCASDARTRAFNSCDKRPWRGMCWKRMNIPLLGSLSSLRKMYGSLHNPWWWPQWRTCARKHELLWPKVWPNRPTKSSNEMPKHGIIYLRLVAWCY